MWLRHACDRHYPGSGGDHQDPETLGEARASAAWGGSRFTQLNIGADIPFPQPHAAGKVWPPTTFITTPYDPNRHGESLLHSDPPLDLHHSHTKARLIALVFADTDTPRNSGFLPLLAPP